MHLLIVTLLLWATVLWPADGIERNKKSNNVGLLKLLAEDGGASPPLLVANARQNVVYLFQYPRTATAPGLAMLNLKVETWLHWNRGRNGKQGIKFHRLSNQYSLGSHSDGTTPFAQHNGAFIDGSDGIVRRLTEAYSHCLDYADDNPGERALRSEIDQVFYRVLVYDRVQDLTYYREDEGQIEQFSPLLLDKVSQKMQLNGKKCTIELNSVSWSAYFDAFNAPIERQEQMRTQFLRNFVKTKRNLEPDDWDAFNTWIRALIDGALKRVFSEDIDESSGQDRNPNSVQSKAREGQLKAYSSYSGEEIAEELRVRLDRVKQRLAQNGGTHLFDLRHSKLVAANRTPADASLFGFLVEFFETPLNVEGLRRLAEEERRSGGVLIQFVEHVKRSLGLGRGPGGGDPWKELSRRPWPLNYDADFDPQKPKYEGPFEVRGGKFAKLPKFRMKGGGRLSVRKWGFKRMAGEVREAVKRLADYANERQPKELRKHYLAGTMHIMASFLCGVETHDLHLEMSCAQQHLEKAAAILARMGMLSSENKKLASAGIAQSIDQDLLVAIRTLVRKAVVDYNEAMVKRNLLGAVAAAGKVAASNDPEIAQSAVSKIEVGDDL